VPDADDGDADDYDANNADADDGDHTACIFTPSFCVLSSLLRLYFVTVSICKHELQNCHNCIGSACIITLGG